jgi:hypothetical protein
MHNECYNGYVLKVHIIKERSCKMKKDAFRMQIAERKEGKYG